jgi:cell division protease FtsH
LKKFFRGPGIFVILLLSVILLSTLVQPAPRYDDLKYDEFLALVEQDKIKELNITEYVAVGLYEDSLISESQFPQRYDFRVDIINNIMVLHEDLRAITARLDGVSPDTVSSHDYHFVLSNSPLPTTPWWVTPLSLLLPVALMAGVWILFMRSQQGGNNKVMSFGKSKARVQSDGQHKVTFDMVAGADEEKEELQEIVDFLKNPKKYIELGARIPKGVLLVGSPGTGKTYLAKAVAGEAGVPFFSISGSDFVEMFVGVGASRVRDLFEQAKKNAPAIVFIDEIDAVGRQRGAGLGGGHDEREQTLNQLLVEMDGFAVNEGVIIIAATNRPDILDPALLRPGRFDRQIPVHLPDIRGREAVLQVHSKGKPLADEVDLHRVAQRTPYFTPADLENIMNEAAILSARRNKQKIGMLEIEDSITRVMIGPEKKSRVVSEKDKRMVAYHEGGHAVVAYFLPRSDRVHEVSIIPRGRAGGYTMSLPAGDMDYNSREKMREGIAISMGGRVAEVLKIGDMTTGASGDIQSATQTARSMVTKYGMSDEIGMVFLGGDQEVFLGREFGHTQNYSEVMAAKIDQEIKKILDEAYNTAKRILTEHSQKLDDLANALLEREKINTKELEEIMGVPPLNKEEWDRTPDLGVGRAAEVPAV